MIYGLFIAIENYRPPIPALNGCLNDAHQFYELLLQNFPQTQLDIRFLFNRMATRKAIVNAFRTHLGKAQPNDVILLFFSGHGSRQRGAVEFRQWGWTADEFEEGIVAFDSRSDSKYDLADKEIAILLDEVIRPGIHALTIFDCCHSSSMTRQPIAELIPKYASPSHVHPRPLHSYLNGYFINRPGAQHPQVSSPQHIALSACCQNEQAFEMNGSGLFTKALNEILQQTGFQVGLAPLLVLLRERVSMQLRGKKQNQTPRIEVTGFSAATPGLFGPATTTPYDPSRIYQDGAHHWIGYGGIDGISHASNAEVKLFDQYKNRVGTGTTQFITPSRSSIRIPKHLWREVKYATPIWNQRDQPSTFIKLFIPETYLSTFQKLVSRETQKHIQFTSLNDAEFVLQTQSPILNLVHKDSNYPIFSKFPERQSLLLDSIFQFLLRWKRGLKMQGNGIKEETIDWQIHLGPPFNTNYNCPHKISAVLSPEVPCSIQIRVRNLADLPMYFTLVYFAESGGIYAYPTEKASPKSSYVTLYGKVPEEVLFLEANKKLIVDHLRILVTNYYPDAQLLTQVSIQEYINSHDRTKSLKLPSGHPPSSERHNFHWKFYDITLRISEKPAP